MVTTDISQIAGECSTWRNTLRDQRADFTSLKEKLQLLSTNLQEKNELQDLEHLQNQFYIQLINIHDLKHAIKTHEQKMNYEKSAHNGMLQAETVAEHENLLDQYQTLDLTLQELRAEFEGFLSRAM